MSWAICQHEAVNHQAHATTTHHHSWVQRVRKLLSIFDRPLECDGQTSFHVPKWDVSIRYGFNKMKCSNHQLVLFSTYTGSPQWICCHKKNLRGVLKKLPISSWQFRLDVVQRLVAGLHKLHSEPYGQCIVKPISFTWTSQLVESSFCRAKKVVERCTKNHEIEWCHPLSSFESTFTPVQGKKPVLAVGVSEIRHASWDIS